MQDNQKNNRSYSPGRDGEAENHQVGRDLYNRDQQRNQSNQGQHRPDDRRWDAGNNFHTGYSNQQQSHFPEDSHQRNTNADRGASLGKHYGEREYSTYRNPNSLNYGDGRGNSTRSNEQYNPYSGNNNNNNNPQSSYGDGRGNYNARQDSDGRGHDRIHSDNHLSAQRRRDDSNENYYRGAYMDSRGVQEEKPRPDDNPYNEYPGSRSRYKDDDYRYGSGNHDWYHEQRYTANDGHRADRDKGSVIGDMGEGVREAWQDMTHGVKNMFNRHSDHDNDDRHQDNRPRNDYNQNQRGNNQEYRSPRDRGTEKGPRWSDETDSGDDSFFYSRDNNPRYY